MNTFIQSPAPPVLSNADERELLEELELAATGKLDFRTPTKDNTSEYVDRSLLPYASVFDARNTPGSTIQQLASPSRPQLLSRRDELEAESVLENQNIEVAYAQVMTILAAHVPGTKEAGQALHRVLVELEQFCLKQSFQLNNLCQKMMHNTLKHVSYQNAAMEMRQEAATWCLLRHLFFESPIPEAEGADLPSSSLRSTINNIISSKSDLVDMAKVVSWLEFLAALDLDASHGKLPKVTAGDGVWRETRAQISIRNNAIVSQLDPDATSREGKDLSKENMRDNDKLMKLVWNLLRAGRYRDACNICRECGQSWKAASLSAAGAYGPTPVGEVALSQQLDPMFSDREIEVIADEFDVKPGLRRFLWKGSCYATSENIRTVVTADNGLGGTQCFHEAATYGLLCGNIKQIIPVCNSWEDFMWAYCRSTLEHQVDIGIRSNLDDNNLSMAWLQEVQRNCPDSVVEISNVINQIDMNSVVQERGQPQRKVQTLFILKEYSSILMNIRNWILHPDDYLKDQISFAEPPANPTMMRFGAHIVLALRYLGVFSSSESSGYHFSEFQDLINKILQVYIIHLMDTEQHDLIPVYAAHLRETSLDLTYMIFFDEMMKYSVAEQHKCYTLACRYLNGSISRLACKYASKVMQETEGSVESNAEHRANATTWLCYEESMFESALQHSLLLCRDFALGGPKCFEAASTLLLQILSPEFWQWLSESQFESSHNIEVVDGKIQPLSKNTLLTAQELYDWKVWYEFQDAFRKWVNLCTILADENGKGMSASLGSSDEKTISSMGESLIDQAMTMLNKNWLCQYVDTESNSTIEDNASMFLLCEMVPKPAGQEGIGFTDVAESIDPSKVNCFEAAIRQSLKSISKSNELSMNPLPSNKFELQILGNLDTNDDSIRQLAYNLGWAIKGNLSKDLQDIGLHVQHIDSQNDKISTFLCRQVCVSKLLLQCIYIRQTLSSFSISSKKSATLIQSISGVYDSQSNFTEYFTPFQLQELILMEREASINELEMGNKL